MSSDQPKVAVDNLIDPFFEGVGKGFRAAFGRGQIYWTHTYYPHEHLEVWRPKTIDVSSGTASGFDPTSSARDMFRRSVPLFNPRLTTSEEFLLIRAKRRPVVLLADVPPALGITKLRTGGVIERHLAICAPLYSIDHKDTSQPKFPPEFIDRLRLAEYPHFFYTPPHPLLQGRRSFLRLDSLQSMFRANLGAVDLKLTPEALALLDSQCAAYMHKKDDGVYAEYRKQLLNQA